MARLSAENNAEHLAALNTPKQKGGKSRFKDFFKTGHSRPSLSGGSVGSSPPTSPAMPSPMGIENLKPGFEKVGLHPAERAKLLDLEVWEKLKEENQHLSHADKIRLYKQMEKEQRADTHGSDQPKLAPMSVGTEEQQKVSKAHEVPGFPTTTSEDEPAIPDDEKIVRTSILSELGEDPIEQDSDDMKAKMLRDACEDDTSISDTSNHGPSDHLAEDLPAKAGAISPGLLSGVDETHSQVHHSSPSRDVGTRDLDQVDMDDAISNISEPRDDKTVYAGSFMSIDQKITDAIEKHEALSSHPVPSVIDNTRRGYIANLLKRVRVMILADHEMQSTSGSYTQAYKFGPFALDVNTAMDLVSFTTIACAGALVFAAIKGPYDFLMLAWDLLVIFVAYKAMSTFLGWGEDGERDVLLVPAEEVLAMAKNRIAELVTALLEKFAQAMVAALNEADPDDSM